jgi:hypothetical protein
MVIVTCFMIIFMIRCTNMYKCLNGTKYIYIVIAGTHRIIYVEFHDKYMLRCMTYACITQRFGKLVYEYNWVMILFVYCLDVFKCLYFSKVL